MKPKDVMELINKGETPNIELKGPMAFEGDHRVELTKDIIAMANTRDGGAIIIGVTDRPSRIIQGLTSAQLNSFDPTKICNFIKNKASPVPKIHAFQVIMPEGVTLLVLEVPEFDDQPIVCTNVGQTSANHLVFKEGDLLSRTIGSESAPIKGERELRHLLGIAIRKKRDGLLKDIADIMKGENRNRDSEAIEQWEEEEDIIKQSEPLYGNPNTQSHYVFRPLNRLDGQPKTHSQLVKTVDESTLHLRSTSFPEIPTDSPITNNQTDSGSAYIEYYRPDPHFGDKFLLFDSMCFYLCRRTALLRNEANEPMHAPEYILTVAEFFEFMKRAFEKEENAPEAIRYMIRLTGVKNKQLWIHPLEPLSMWSDRFVCTKDDIKVKGTISMASLKADPRALAVDALLRIFPLFQADQISADYIQQKIKLLYDRKIG